MMQAHPPTAATTPLNPTGKSCGKGPSERMWTSCLHRLVNIQCRGYVQVRRLRAATRRRSRHVPVRLRQPHVLIAVPSRPAQLRATAAPARHAGLPRLLPLPPRREASPRPG